MQCTKLSVSNPTSLSILFFFNINWILTPLTRPMFRVNFYKCMQCRQVEKVLLKLCYPLGLPQKLYKFPKPGAVPHQLNHVSGSHRVDFYMFVTSGHHTASLKFFLLPTIWKHKPMKKTVPSTDRNCAKGSAQTLMTFRHLKTPSWS